MMRAWSKSACCILLISWALACAAATQKERANAGADDDPVLQAMRAELERSKGQLKLEQMATPYYIDYRATDIDDYSAEAAFGAMRGELRSHTRFLRVVVRVGDYKQDSFFGTSGGEGTVDVMSVDNDVVTLRRQLWLATDRAYKAALEALAAKRAQLKQYTIDQPVDDFAPAEPVQMVMPLVKLEFEPQRWTRMLKAASAIYKRDMGVQYVETALRFSAVNRYLVNSEGTMTRHGQTLYEMGMSEYTQASDGMRLDRSHQFTVPDMKDLPSEAEFTAEAVKLMATFKELAAAPLVEEEYHGPVLFSGDASADVFADLVGENVLGRKPKLGETTRTTGTWATNYKTRVLPEFLSVYDDPTISSLEGQKLLGSYPVDDEGVKPARVSLIENGKLVNYLLGREPLRDFPVSNGHGRARIPLNLPGPSIGNLIVHPAQSMSPRELKEKLIALCRERDLPYGYYVETLGPQRIPRLLYRVWVKDGHEELVRGAIFGSLDTRALRDNLIAAGNDMYVDNRPLNIPHSIVAPSVLFDELEIKRENKKNDKLPDYPVPVLETAK